MAHLVLTVAGSDRSGLVRSLAELVAASGGNWRRSELAEIAGVFAGVVLVDVPDARSDELTAALGRLHGLLEITHRVADPDAPVTGGRTVAVTVLGNDHPGIVRDVTTTLASSGLSVDRFTSSTQPAPMSGGELFRADVVARAADAQAVEDAIARLELLAAEIQVDIAVDPPADD